jgi:hypothetical protein
LKANSLPEPSREFPHTEQGICPTEQGISATEQQSHHDGCLRAFIVYPSRSARLEVSYGVSKHRMGGPRRHGSRAGAANAQQSPGKPADGKPAASKPARSPGAGAVRGQPDNRTVRARIALLIEIMPAYRPVEDDRAPRLVNAQIAGPIADALPLQGSGAVYCVRADIDPKFSGRRVCQYSSISDIRICSALIIAASTFASESM